MNIFDKVKTFFVCYRNIILVSIVILIVLITLIVFNKEENEYNCEYLNEISTSEIEKTNSEEELVDYIYVDIKGEVKNPGVYKMNNTDRVIDVLNKALLLKSSNTTYINLSKSLSDQMVIYVYSNDEIKNILDSYIEVCEIIQNDACIEKEDNMDSVYNQSNNESISTNLDKTLNSDSNEVTETKVVNINTASLDELMTLTGIGESKAKNIISYREENGLFKSIEDIKNVSGIGDALFESIKDSITI